MCVCARTDGKLASGFCSLLENNVIFYFCDDFFLFFFKRTEKGIIIILYEVCREAARNEAIFGHIWYSTDDWFRICMKSVYASDSNSPGLLTNLWLVCFCLFAGRQRWDPLVGRASGAEGPLSVAEGV